MRSAKGSLKERLARYRQIKLGVIGRKSGQTISNPVWALPNVTPRHRSANAAPAITLVSRLAGRGAWKSLHPGKLAR